MFGPEPAGAVVEQCDLGLRRGRGEPRGEALHEPLLQLGRRVVPAACAAMTTRERRQAELVERDGQLLRDTAHGRREADARGSPISRAIHALSRGSARARASIGIAPHAAGQRLVADEHEHPLRVALAASAASRTNSIRGGRSWRSSAASTAPARSLLPRTFWWTASATSRSATAS